MVIPLATALAGEFVVALPCDPDTIWNTLPASLNTVVETSLLLSVNLIVVPPIVRVKSRVPGNMLPLNLDLSTLKAYNDWVTGVTPPKLKVLFGGCFTRSIESKGLGYTGEAYIEQWPKSAESVLLKYPEARLVIPGHGKIGDLALLMHTKTLAEAASNKSM